MQRNRCCDINQGRIRIGLPIIDIHQRSLTGWSSKRCNAAWPGGVSHPIPLHMVLCGMLIMNTCPAYNCKWQGALSCNTYSCNHITPQCTALAICCRVSSMHNACQHGCMLRGQEQYRLPKVRWIRFTDKAALSVYRWMQPASGLALEAVCIPNLLCSVSVLGCIQRAATPKNAQLWKSKSAVMPISGAVHMPGGSYLCSYTALQSLECNP